MNRLKLYLLAGMVGLLFTVDMNAQTQNDVFWVLARSWSHGFKALPDVSTNLNEFRKQYYKNPEQWKAAFRWLATNDLLLIQAGKYPIKGTSLIVSVEDSRNEQLNTRKSESHRKFIDLQYVVKGIERFALIDHASSKPNSKYLPDVQHYNYDATKAVFIDSTPDRFFLFFPDDWHIAKIATDKDNQDIRVIVIKLAYMQ